MLDNASHFPLAKIRNCWVISTHVAWFLKLSEKDRQLSEKIDFTTDYVVIRQHPSYAVDPCTESPGVSAASSRFVTVTACLSVIWEQITKTAFVRLYGFPCARIFLMRPSADFWSINWYCYQIGRSGPEFCVCGGKMVPSAGLNGMIYIYIYICYIYMLYIHKIHTYTHTSGIPLNPCAQKQTVSQTDAVTWKETFNS
jgi:hypothetical protein